MQKQIFTGMSPNVALEALQAMGGKVLRFCEILSCAFRETVFLFVGIMALLTDHNERVLSFKWKPASTFRIRTIALKEEDGRHL